MPAYFDTGFSVRQPMWHGLGEVLDEYPEDWNHARRLAGLEWEPHPQPLYTPPELVDYDTAPATLDGQGVRKLNEFKAIARDDTYTLGGGVLLGGVASGLLGLLGGFPPFSLFAVAVGGALVGAKATQDVGTVILTKRATARTTPPRGLSGRRQVTVGDDVTHPDPLLSPSLVTKVEVLHSQGLMLRARTPSSPVFPAPAGQDKAIAEWEQRIRDALEGSLDDFWFSQVVSPAPPKSAFDLVTPLRYHALQHRLEMLEHLLLVSGNPPKVSAMPPEVNPDEGEDA